MMSGKKNCLGLLLLAALMGVTGAVLLRGESLRLLGAALRQLRPPFLLLALGAMVGYVGCEALCTKQILGRLGHRVPYRQCLGYSFVGFYVSSITPSATGGQPAQIYYMSRDQIPAAHGALNMMLIAACYQAATLIWGGGVWLLVPRLRHLMSGGWSLLLIYGAGMMVLLTLGMAMVMFLPNPARRICQGILSVLTALRILRSPQAAQEKIDRQLAEYARGAACIKRNPGLALRVLGLCMVQLGLLFSVPWMVYLAFGLTGSSWLQVAGTQALVTLCVCNLPLPGAVGPAEGTFVAAFTPLFGSTLATPAMLVSRSISFYSFLPVSFAVAAAVHLRTSRQARERALREMTASQTHTRVQAVRTYLNARAEKAG
ncbi:MAG: flippase-like domain-containing protein [Lawsonibacter sp.]|nr:flippase-like domain-containing protein [Lawsonibacter sp.]